MSPSAKYFGKRSASLPSPGNRSTSDHSSALRFSGGSLEVQLWRPCPLLIAGGSRSRYQRACQSSSAIKPARRSLASSSRAFSSVERLRETKVERVLISRSEERRV